RYVVMKEFSDQLKPMLDSYAGAVTIITRYKNSLIELETNIKHLVSDLEQSLPEKIKLYDYALQKYSDSPNDYQNFDNELERITVENSDGLLKNAEEIIVREAEALDFLAQYLEDDLPVKLNKIDQILKIAKINAPKLRKISAK